MAGRRTATAVARVSSAELAKSGTKVAVVEVPLLAPLLQLMVRAGVDRPKKGGGGCTGPVCRESNCPLTHGAWAYPSEFRALLSRAKND